VLSVTVRSTERKAGKGIMHLPTFLSEGHVNTLRIVEISLFEKEGMLISKKTIRYFLSHITSVSQFPSDFFFMYFTSKNPSKSRHYDEQRKKK